MIQIVGMVLGVCDLNFSPSLSIKMKMLPLTLKHTKPTDELKYVSNCFIIKAGGGRAEAADPNWPKCSCRTGHGSGGV